MKVEQVDKNVYMAEDEVAYRVSISHAGGHVRLTKEQAYLLCYEVLTHLHKNDY
jgi:hypothetical protein